MNRYEFMGRILTPKPPPGMLLPNGLSIKEHKPSYSFFSSIKIPVHVINKYKLQTAITLYRILLVHIFPVRVQQTIPLFFQISSINPNSTTSFILI